MPARLLAVAILAYFLSGERVVSQLAETRTGLPPIHVETSVSSTESGAPTRLAFDLHPQLGLRASDDRGRRWLVQRGRVIAGTELPPPPWLPDLEVLALASADALNGWLVAHGIDASTNELARCGEGDCYVLGARTGAAQLWVDKNALEVRRVVVPGQAALELEDWQAFEKRRFPAEIVLENGSGPIATFRTQTVSAAPALGIPDFSQAWVQAAKPRPE